MSEVQSKSFLFQMTLIDTKIRWVTHTPNLLHKNNSNVIESEKNVTQDL